LRLTLVPQEPPVITLIETVLRTLGLECTVSEDRESPCVVDTRHRAGHENPGEAASVGSTVYFDDYIPLEKMTLAVQGRTSGSPEFFTEPEFSIKSRAFFESIRRVFASKGLPLVAKSYWPNGAPACLVLTHDVDWFSYSPLHKSVKQGKSLPRFSALVARYTLGKRYGDNIRSTVQLESSMGVKSTFLFRTHYEADKDKLADSVRFCRNAGSEVALHSAKKAYKYPPVMAQEKAEMEELKGAPVSGLRQHELRFEYDKTWDCVESSGLTYDMTFGRNEKTGFISGLCHPYHPMSLDGRAYDLLEIPTSFMDWTAIHAGMNFTAIRSLLDRLKRTAESLNGCLCVNFHNTYIDRELFPDIEKAYSLLISDCKEAGFWIATAEECAGWWRKREEITLDPSVEDGRLRLGEGGGAVQPVVYWPEKSADQPGN
jgi:hypothetical protein